MYEAVEAILWLLLISVVAIGLLFIWAGAALADNKRAGAIEGAKIFAVLLGLCLTYLAYGQYRWGQEEAQRQKAYEKIEREFTEGCFRAFREIKKFAQGNERLLVLLSGADSVPRSQLHDLLPSTSVSEGVTIVRSLPATAGDGILVEIKYSRDLIPGSTDTYKWYRTHYELAIHSLADGSLMAKSVDMEAREGFCLGNLETFLRHVLNRAAVFREDPIGSRWKRAPEASSYVRATYSEQESGKVFEDARPHDFLATAKSLLFARGCRMKAESISEPVAICSTHPENSVELSLKSIVGLLELSDSWLFVYRNDQGVNPLTSLRIHQRNKAWAIRHVWHVQILPPLSGSGGQEYIGNLVLSGDSLIVATFRDMQWE